MGWLDIGFIIVVALVVCWVFEGAIDKQTGRLKDIELSQEAIDKRLKLIEYDTKQALSILDQKQETIEEQWLRENYQSPA